MQMEVLRPTFFVPTQRKAAIPEEIISLVSFANHGETTATLQNAI
jgi:hypothetical protein